MSTPQMDVMTIQAQTSTLPTAQYELAKETKDFLNLLFAHRDGYTELRALPSRDQLFVTPSQRPALERFVQTHWKMNLYVGVASRRNDKSGALENCLELWALFADIDFKRTPESEAHQRLAECPFLPSMIVASGGGLHVYWLLREPLQLQNEHDRTQAKSLLRRLAALLHADPVSAEPAHILRLPGTSNYKYDPPRPVVLELCEPTRQYNVSEWGDVLPP